ncbi:DUF2199 domain-containing protein [Pseudonocardiaceae bacterium YIM PH 21723]|nr:DUF2199 domain-containing protein [Pseudonocardiaceae bacterium YIM PH 21723]
MAHVSASECTTCGRALDDHARDIRFGLPDPVLEVPENLRAEHTWQTDDMMTVDGIGAFMRVLLPVRLTGGFEVTFGTWIGVRPLELERAFAIWPTREYADFAVNGWLANRIDPWGLLGIPLTASVRDVNQIPYITGSSDPFLDHLLQERVPVEPVVEAWPGYVDDCVRQHTV